MFEQQLAIDGMGYSSEQSLETGFLPANDVYVLE